MSRFFSARYSSLDAYVPGEQPKDKRYIKLNTNESPFPPSENTVKAASLEARELMLYSDPEASLLTEKCAELSGVSRDMVLMTNGSDEILNFAFMAFSDEKHPIVFPEISYGFGVSINYRKFDFSLLFQGTANVSILMSNHHPFMTKDVTGLNMTQWVADDHWTKDNPYASYPRLSSVWNNNNTAQSSFWVKNGAYFRLKNVEMGYSFLQFRAFLTASNLFTISPFKYWDPEMGSGNGLSYPIQTVVRLGLQYNFQ
jgi:hypothetical protein